MKPFKGMSLDGGDTSSQRLLIQVPNGAKLKMPSVSIDMGNNGLTRAFVYDVSGVS